MSMSSEPSPTPSDQRALDLTSALADPTRYAIYRALVDAAGEPLTVLEMAERFSLHPNVARMHLQKLVDVGLLQSDTRRSPGGGRPARIYRLSTEVTTLQFPPRDYELLASLSLQVIDILARDDAGLLERVGAAMGREEALRALAHDHLDPARATLEHRVESLRRTCGELGLSPRIETNGDSVQVEIRNCVFRELSPRYPQLVCGLHTALLRGILEVYFGDVALDSRPAIFAGESSCLFKATIPIA